MSDTASGDATASDVGHDADFSTPDSATEPDAGSECTRTGEGCVPDGDGDGYADFEDNCVMVSNSDQMDLDGDGLGDACDAEPACVIGHVDGVLARGPLPYAASGASIPEYATQWLVAAGGRNAAGELVDLLAQFPGASAPVTSVLPYAAERFGAVQIGDGEYVLTPGDLGAGAQFGRLLHVFADGTARQGLPFTPSAFEPVLSAGPGGMLFVGRAAATSTEYQFVRFDEQAQLATAIGQADFGTEVRWHVTRDGQGVSTFYSSIVDPATLEGRYAVVGPDAASMTVEVVSYPDVDGTFDPLLSPAPGGGYYAWDRTTGRGFVFEAGVFREGLELAITSPAAAAGWVSQPAGPGLHLMGDDGTGLRAWSLSIACLPAVATFDSDQDGIIDPLDLCPNDAASSGSDADLDWVGDGCDPDADGDGLLDVDDPFPSDTDNDGVPNDLDDDDDADGVPDAADRFVLDTDNDGMRNAVDLDDDDDGVTDADEIAAGTDPLDPLRFEGSGTVAWVADGRVNFAALADLELPQELARAETTAPSSVRFAAAGQAIMLVSGPPGTTSQIEFTPLGGTPQVVDIGAVLWGADVASGDVNGPVEIVVAHQNELAADVQLGMYDLASQSLRPIVTVLSRVESPDISGAMVVFAAQPQGCSSCRSPYVVDVMGPIPRIVAPMVSNPSTIRYNDGAITLLGNASDGNGHAAWFGEPANPNELRPPSATDVSSAVGYADGHVVMAATGEDGHGLWLWNGTKRRWHKLVDTDEAVVELDWAR